VCYSLVVIRAPEISVLFAGESSRSFEIDFLDYRFIFTDQKSIEQIAKVVFGGFAVSKVHKNLSF
jgi:hypothetical protein